MLEPCGERIVAQELSASLGVARARIVAVGTGTAFYTDQIVYYPLNKATTIGKFAVVFAEDVLCTETTED